MLLSVDLKVDQQVRKEEVEEVTCITFKTQLTFFDWMIDSDCLEKTVRLEHLDPELLGITELVPCLPPFPCTCIDTLFDVRAVLSFPF